MLVKRKSNRERLYSRDLIEFIEFAPKKQETGIGLKDLVRENLLIILIVSGVIVGIFFGLNLRLLWSAEDSVLKYYLAFPGKLFLNMLKMMIIPLLTTSLITGMLTGDTPISGKVVATAGIYHFGTAWIALGVGVGVILTFVPSEQEHLKSDTRNNSYTMGDPIDAFFDLLRQCFPDNLIRACSERDVTDFVRLDPSTKDNLTNDSLSDFNMADIIVPTVISLRGTNLLGLVVISIVFGHIINFLDNDGKPLQLFFISINSVMMSLMNVFIWYTPVGVIFLIASSMFETVDLEQRIDYLTRYICLIIGSLAIHGFVDLPVIYFIFTRKSPWLLASNVSEALCTAWGTNSSSTTLPVTMKCLIKNCELNQGVVKFMVPLSTTFNFDGAMLYEALTCVYIARVNGFSLGFVDIIVISLTSSAASVWSNAVPQSSLLTTTVIMTTMGLPTDAITLILSIDWIMDRFRTVVNVWGDCIGAGILHHLFEDIFPNSLFDENRQRQKRVSDVIESLNVTDKDDSIITIASFAGTESFGSEGSDL